MKISKYLYIDERLENYTQSEYSDVFNLLFKFAKVYFINSNDLIKLSGFSIFIGFDNKVESNNYDIIYIVKKSIITSTDSNDFEITLVKALNDFKIRDLNVHLYLGKFPGYGIDVDGGSILAKQLITILKKRCNLTLTFIRKNKETFSDSQVIEINYVEYLDATKNKFERRLLNLKTNKKAIGNYKSYDCIITAHISKFFGFADYPDDFWKKTILFPMFCTSSYIRSGHIVPKEYTLQEQIVINKVNKIITPSIEEKEDIINDYNCNPEKIKLISRGISPHITYNTRKKCNSPLTLISIGSIKPQKNNKELIYLLLELEYRNIPCILNIVCTVQDKNLYNEMLFLIDKYNLSSKIKFYFSISQLELAHLLKSCDINISTSNWETFGRGIFEGISAGLPTIVFDKLTVIKTICSNNSGVIFIKNIKEMADSIVELSQNDNLYENMSTSLLNIAKKVSYKKEQVLLLKEILGLGGITIEK